MKQVFIVTLLVAAICGSLLATPPSGALAEPLAPISCEIVDEVPVNGEVHLLLHVEAGECVENVSITWFSWNMWGPSDTLSMQKSVGGEDSVAFPVVMSIPEPSDGTFTLTVRMLQKKVKSENPCYRVYEYVDRWGRRRTSTNEVSKEDESGERRFLFQVSDGAVVLINVVPGPDDGFADRDDPWAKYGGDPRLQKPAEAVRTPMSEPREPYTAPREMTEEEKREFDSLLGISAPLTKAEKKAKLEEKPLEGMNRQFFALDGVMYVRDRGEKKFRASEPMTLEEVQAWTLRRQDSIAAIPPETEFEVRIWLTNQDDLNWTQEQVDSLKPTDEPDCYITQTSLEVIRKLQEHGVKIGTVKPL